jgi:hypothetical protein
MQRRDHVWVVGGTGRQLGVAQPQKTALELGALQTAVLGHPRRFARAALSRADVGRLDRGAAPQRARRSK